MNLELQFLNARQGDAIWVRWGDGRQILIDMGTHQTGTKLANRLRNLPEEQREFELLVVTHVDGDHIGGVLSGVSDAAQPVPGLSFKDVWFNGFEHLSGQIPAPQGIQLEPMGGPQGEKFSKWLREQPWNEAFGRGPIVRSDLLPIDMGDGLTLTVLGPTQTRLEELIPKWTEEVHAAIDEGNLEEISPGLEPMGPSTPPVLESKIDLELLAEANSPKDDSESNGASITLLLEWEGHRVLLTGDAFAADVRDGLAELDTGNPVPLSLLKTPHHGSRGNMSKALVEMVDCPLWVFTSDGTQFRHPDAQAIARILNFGLRSNPTLAFNVRSKFSGWWDNEHWRNLFEYEVLYGTEEDGITVILEPTN